MHTIQRFVCCASPRALSGDEARAMVGLLAEAERAVGSGIALFAPVVIESGSYAKDGHGSASDWLGALSGTSSAAAKGRLAAAERAASDPMLTQALHEGELSAAQLKLVSEVAAVAPGAADTLLDLAGPGASHQELNAAALALRTAARSKEDERARRLRVHRVRHLRAHQCAEGGIRGEFFCDEVAWAKVAPWLEAAPGSATKRPGTKSRSTRTAWIPSSPSWAHRTPVDQKGASVPTPWSSSMPPPCAAAVPWVRSSARSRGLARSRSKRSPNSWAKAACSSWSETAPTSRL